MVLKFDAFNAPNFRTITLAIKLAEFRSYFSPFLGNGLPVLNDPLQVFPKTPIMAPIAFNLVVIAALLVFKFGIGLCKFFINCLEPINLELVL